MFLNGVKTHKQFLGSVGMVGVWVERHVAQWGCHVTRWGQEWWWRGGSGGRGIAEATHEVRAVGDMPKAENVRDVRATTLYLIYGWQCS